MIGYVRKRESVLALAVSNLQHSERSASDLESHWRLGCDSIHVVVDHGL